MEYVRLLVSVIKVDCLLISFLKHHFVSLSLESDISRDIDLRQAYRRRVRYAHALLTLVETIEFLHLSLCAQVFQIVTDA